MNAPAKPTHNDIYERLGTIIDRLDTLDAQVSEIKAKVLAYDKLKERATGALMALSVAVAVIWWLTRQKIAAVFGVSTS